MQDALKNAAAIALPGSENTLQDLEWLKRSGMAEIITAKTAQGIPVLGICGGFQMLGHELSDPEGYAGKADISRGLGLLPINTILEKEKRVTQVNAHWKVSVWKAYEIHMDKTNKMVKTEPLLKISEATNGNRVINEGVQIKNICGTYLHVFFESPATRAAFVEETSVQGYQCNNVLWEDHKQQLYSDMADLIESDLELEEVFKYVGL